MGKPEYPGEIPLVRCSANPMSMILILMRVSLPPKLKKTTKERDAHIHSHMHIYVLMQYYGKAMPTVNASEGVGGKAEKKSQQHK